MIAVKANKEYRVTEENKQIYLNDGYDIMNDNGEIIEYSPKKTIKYSEYQKLEKELEEAKANGSNVELTKQVEELTKANEVLTSEKDELTKNNGELTKANVELTKQVEKLTKQLEKANVKE